MRVLHYVVMGMFAIGVWGCDAPTQPKVTIAAAANMQFALTEITEAFTQETGVACEVILGSSGKLNAQIKEGAPYDVFVSADMKYPQDLYETGFAWYRPQIYAYGTLVLWSYQEELHPTFEVLDSAGIKHIAIANPKTAPYGIAASQVLHHLGYEERLAHKLVFGESAGQTNQFIITGAAEVGLTAKSVVMSPQMKNKGHWVEVPHEYYDAIAQGIVFLKNKKETSPEPQANTRLFYDFMFSDQARAILKKYGYQVPEIGVSSFSKG